MSSLRSLDRDEIVWIQKRAVPTHDNAEDDDFLSDDEDDLEDN
jgi:hypothetical protein